MQLIQDAQGWDRLRRTAEDEHGITVQFPWAEPEEYPLLADYIFADDELHICTVYLADAVLLVQASGLSVDSKTAHKKPSSRNKGNKVPIISPKSRDTSVGLGADLLTIIQLLLDTGIATEKVYEERLAAMETAINAGSLSSLLSRRAQCFLSDNGDGSAVKK